MTISNRVILSYLENASNYLSQYIDKLEQLQENPYNLPVLFAASVAYLQYRLQLLALQNQQMVYVPCDAPATINARSHPSFYGRFVATYHPGAIFTNYEERLDFPEDTDSAPKNWVRISEYYSYFGYTQWIRREDTEGNAFLLDGGQVQGNCAPNPDPVPGPQSLDPSPSFSTHGPGCTRGGTCLTGTESVPDQVAFILACESGALTAFTHQDRTTARQVAVDIAYVIRNRKQASGFPNTLVEVISQASERTDPNTHAIIGWDYAFQCYGEGSADNITLVIDHVLPIAEELATAETDGRSPVLPPPSFPEIHDALWFFGLPWQNLTSLSPNTIDRTEVRDFFINEGIVNLSSTFETANTLFGGLYIGHGPIMQPDPQNNPTGGSTTFFFSDNPRFTGIIPP